MEPSDEILIHRFQGGEQEAFELLALRWQDRVHEIALRLLGDGEEAKEAQQTVLFRTFSALRQFDGRSRFSTWLYRVVVNQCRDRMRRRARRPEISLGSVETLGPESPSTADRASQREVSQMVARAVWSLPEAEKQVVVLKHYGDLSFSEIAEILDLPTSTVKSRMTRGLGRLKSPLAHLDQRR